MTGTGRPSATAVPSVLMVRYSCTQQTRTVAEEMAAVRRGRGGQVASAAIE